MLIEIHGADFKNKGGELMLRTTVNEIKKRLPEASFVVDPLIGSFEERNELGLFQYFPPRGWMGSNKFRYLFLLQKAVAGIGSNSSYFKKILKSYGCVTVNKVDALVDISGFAFTSQWGAQPCLDFAYLTSWYRKRNKPVIMLPQAFGPFQSREIKDGMRDIIDNSNLIYVRDKISYKYLKEINDISTDILKMAPDITFFYPRKENILRKPDFNNECLVIPNIRMLDQGAEGWGETYLKTLTTIIDHIKEKGREVAILIHDSKGKDLSIAEQVSKDFGKSLKVYDITDPLAIKEKISTAPFVVTSRYHGAIASFSQFVPSLCMGWSHKYNELYDSFDMSDFIISSDSSIKSITNRIDQLLDMDKNELLRKKISGFLKNSKKENENMWETVINELKK